MAKVIMIQGTASNVGKSIITTGLCRIFAQDGYKVAPFKSINLSDIGFTTPDGKEMSQAQALQAKAAGRQPDVRMNPILIKPKILKDNREKEAGSLSPLTHESKEYTSEIIFHGYKIEDSFREKFWKNRTFLLEEIQKSYQSLADENDIIVIEGAGSGAEINLADKDIANMAVAEITQSPVLIVGDIDRGGVFAALYGSVMLQPEKYKTFIKGTIINKFRGETKFLEPAPQMLASLVGVPTIGVVPYLDIHIEAEDFLSQKEIELEGKHTDQILQSTQQDYDLLAIHLRKSLNMDLIYQILEEGIK